ncbi:MAG: branched-chain amino acid ABC transporter permease [Coxiellaceae bacterium]|nr:branched-chain amino acid ABC transporter permease [Coxiellaceae bacterium]
MDLFLHLLISGLANGAIYASLALAIVMVHKSMGQVNFAQGEMAMFSTFIAWYLMSLGLPYIAAFFITLFISFLMGLFIEYFIFRRLPDASPLTTFMVILGAFSGFNGLAMLLFGTDMRTFPSPLKGITILDNPYISLHEIAIFVVIALLFLVTATFFKKTRVGLGIRAAAINRESSLLSGIHVEWMLGLGWGIATTIGAVSGILVAPRIFLDPNMMGAVLLYSIAGAILGGLNSEFGAIIGGFIVGVLENMVANYIPFVGNDLKLTVALVVIVMVSIFKPEGLFGKSTVERV